jgi:hypothetical protein
MEEDKTSIDGILEKLALITDATQKLFPYGKTLIVFELDEEDFKKVQKNFRKIDHTHKKFTVDISGVEVVFILENTIDMKIQIEEEKPKKFWGKFKDMLFRKSSVSTVKY